MENETKNVLIKWIMLSVLALLLCLLMFEMGSINEKSKHLKDPAIVVDSVILKDQTETKKLQKIVDSVVKENARLDKIIKRKEYHTSQTLKQNEINISHALAQYDSVKKRIADSLFTR